MFYFYNQFTNLSKAFKSYKAKKDGDKITVKEARFEYSIIPDSKNSSKFKLVPSWVLVYSSNFKGEEITTAVHINAVTGDVIDSSLI